MLERELKPNTFIYRIDPHGILDLFYVEEVYPSPETFADYDLKLIVLDSDKYEHWMHNEIQICITKKELRYFHLLQDVSNTKTKCLKCYNNTTEKNLCSNCNNELYKHLLKAVDDFMKGIKNENNE